MQFIFSRLFFCIIVIAVIFTAIIFLCLYLHSLLPAALGIVWAYALSVTSALFLFCRDGRGDYKCAWLAVIAALPVVGAILYAFSCTGISKREIAPPPPLSSYKDCEYFKDGARYLSRLRQCVAAAKKSVCLEYYIISKGRIWGLLCQELQKALERGVSVKILYDGLGSAVHAPKRDFKLLERAGAQIKVFNKLLPFPVSRLNCRNHRKIAAIDGECVFLGGVNIADEYANLSSPHGYWKDGGIMLKGAVAADYERIFLADFCSTVTTDMRTQPTASNGENCGSSANGKPVRIIADEPANTDGCCEELIAAKIYCATERVCVLTPYLCVGEKLKDALLYAAGRGTRVQIIIPEIPDKHITYEITLAFAAELNDRGIEVYRYTPGFMHAKCMICDNEALLGSYNFDFRSMRLNYECGVWVGGEVAHCALEDFKESLILSRRIDKRASTARRIARGALKLFAPLA